MRIDVVAAGFDISDDLRKRVRQRVLLSLSRFAPGVERITVHLSDEVNPLGGLDRCCRMQAWLVRRKSVRVETKDGALAIERAVERLATRVEWALVDGRGGPDSRLHAPVVSGRKPRR